MRLVSHFALVYLAGLWLPALAQEQTDPFRDIEKLAREEMNRENIPGAALAVVRGDRVIFVKGLGVSSIETKAPVTPDMLFRIASVTKMFTAAATVGIAAEGKLERAQAVEKYLPGLDPAIGALTAHQLLTHTGGLRAQGRAPEACDEQALRRTVHSWRKDQFFTAPGDVYSYSDPGYWLAGYLAEVLDEKPYADVLTERLFRPLGMVSTTLRPSAAITYPLAQGHRPSGSALSVVRPLADRPAAWPAGGMFSSVTDLARWVIALLNSGQLEGTQVLKPEIVAALTSAHTNVPGRASSYGYGLFIRESRGVRVWEHGGTGVGYGALIRMFPEHRVGIIVLTNRTAGALPKTGEAIAQLLLPFKRKESGPVATGLEIGPEEMNKYVGRYVNGDLIVEILIKDARLFARQALLEAPLIRTGAQRFVLTVPGSPAPDEAEVVLRQDGTVAYFCIRTACLKRQP